MGQKEKLLKRLINCQTNVYFSDLCSLAELVGFRFDRQSGSHRIYRHDKYPGIMNFQDCNGQAKPLQVRQLLNFIAEHDLQ
jgi:hypothetical protein